MSDFDTIARRFKAFTNSIGGSQSKAAVNAMLTAVAANTEPMIPVATGKLLNSRTKQIFPSPFGLKGELTYGAGYAKFVHDAPGTLLGTNTPRSPASLGNVWDKSGEPQFLAKGGAKTTTSAALSILQRNYIR